MSRPKLLSAAATPPGLLLALVLALLLAQILALPQAQARRHHYPAGLPYEISYDHNYGPGLEPGTFAYYDGPSTVHCYQGAATYIGQDHRRHPCF